MFVKIEETPNPDACKFFVNEFGISSPCELKMGFDQLLLPKFLADFACNIFNTGYIESLFFMDGCIVISKFGNYSWSCVNPVVLDIISNANFSVKFDCNVQNHDLSDRIVAQIVSIIETKIRPAVAQDGGDILFVRFDQGTVYLKMHGACSGCPSAAITLKNGVQNLLMHHVPEVKSVESV